MKFKNVYKLVAIMVLFVTLQSRSTGPGGTASLQVTGAPGSSGNLGTCANSGCHSSGSFSPSLSIELLDGSSPVSEYEPGKSYMLRVRNTPGSGTPSEFGFQAVALNGADNQAGQWANIGSGKQQLELSGRSYIEHSIPSVNSTFEMEWIAPSVNTGDVTFYSASIAANGNGNSIGDGTANTSLTVTEKPLNSVFDAGREVIRMDLFPNPVQDDLNLQITSRQTGDYEIRIMDITGKMVQSIPATLQPGENRETLSVGQLTPGLYVVQLHGEGQIAAVNMVKQ